MYRVPARHTSDSVRQGEDSGFNPRLMIFISSVSLGFFPHAQFLPARAAAPPHLPARPASRGTIWAGLQRGPASRSSARHSSLPRQSTPPMQPQRFHRPHCPCAHTFPDCPVAPARAHGQVEPGFSPGPVPVAHSESPSGADQVPAPARSTVQGGHAAQRSNRRNRPSESGRSRHVHRRAVGPTVARAVRHPGAEMRGRRRDSEAESRTRLLRSVLGAWRLGRARCVELPAGAMRRAHPAGRATPRWRRDQCGLDPVRTVTPRPVRVPCDTDCVAPSPSRVVTRAGRTHGRTRPGPRDESPIGSSESRGETGGIRP